MIACGVLGQANVRRTPIDKDREARGSHKSRPGVFLETTLPYHIQNLGDEIQVWEWELRSEKAAEVWNFIRVAP